MNRILNTHKGRNFKDKAPNHKFISEQLNIICDITSSQTVV